MQQYIDLVEKVSSSSAVQSKESMAMDKRPLGFDLEEGMYLPFSFLFFPVFRGGRE